MRYLTEKPVSKAVRLKYRRTQEPKNLLRAWIKLAYGQKIQCVYAKGGAKTVKFTIGEKGFL